MTADHRDDLLAVALGVAAGAVIGVAVGIVVWWWDVRTS